MRNTGGGLRLLFPWIDQGEKFGGHPVGQFRGVGEGGVAVAGDEGLEGADERAGGAGFQGVEEEGGGTGRNCTASAIT